VLLAVTLVRNNVGAFYRWSGLLLNKVASVSMRILFAGGTPFWGKSTAKNNIGGGMV